MAKPKILGVSVLLLALAAVGQASPDDRKAGALLQAADAKATIEGDSKAAIALYKEAVAAAGSNNTLIARALFGMGEAYRRVDPAAAQETYARIVRDFSEPKDVVAAARARLAPSRTSRRQPTEGTAARLVLGADGANLVDVNADGTIAVGVAMGPQSNLLIWNVSTSESRILVPVTRGTRVIGGRISPDGRTVAYLWTETLDGKSVSSLRLVGTEEGATPRVLLERDAGPSFWAPDGRSLLVLRGPSGGPQTLQQVNVADGSARTIKAFQAWQEPFGFSISPEGWIAYAIVPRPGSRDRHIYVMDSAGQSDTPVMNAAARSGSPVWTLDGSHLVFGSDKSGVLAVWSIAMHDGQPVGDATRLLSEPMQPISATRSGGMYFRSNNMTDFNQLGFIADLEPGGARIRKAFVGEGISWSPDGKSLAYIRNTGAPLAVVIRSLDTGEERAYVNEDLGLQQARWLPDSSGVIVYVSDRGTSGGGAMYAVDARSGEFKKLVTIRPGRSGVVAVSPDAKSLYVSQKSNSTIELIAVDLATGSERSLGTLPGQSADSAGLSISPDGTALVVQTWADQAKHLGRLLIVRTDGGGTRELLPSFPADRTLSILRWSADGRWIFYFTAAENGDWRLMRISPNGGQPEFAGLDSTRLTGTVKIPPSAPYSPLSMDVSPDGTQVVFAYRPALHTEIWSLDNVLSAIAARQ